MTPISRPYCGCAERLDQLNKLWLFQEEMMAKLVLDKISDGHAEPPRSGTPGEWLALAAIAVAVFVALVLL